MKKILSVVLSVLVILSAVMCTGTIAYAQEGVALTYSFSGDQSTQPGYAEGTITLSVSNAEHKGNYYLYWADDTKALDGYREITTLNVSSINKAVSFDMLEQTAIPVGATNVIAIKSDKEPQNKTVASSTVVYSLGKKALSDNSPLYTFGAISDPQLANDSYGSGNYPNDETHLAEALETLAKRGVDFTVSSGDTVNDQDGAKTYAAEYKAYQRIIADSSYANPIYETNGNHDVQVTWNGSSSNNNKPFIKGTGLDSTLETINAGKPYYEITEPTTGDHFIFVALEGAFRTNENTQFSTAQLDWLEGLLKKYHNDGKNIFIIEHANVQGWGSGDKLTTPYYYDLGLDPNSSDVARFVDLMETYKDCIIITGHTHLELSAHLNFSDNNGTSAVMMHNSAVGGVRRLVNGTVVNGNMINGSIDRDDVLGLSEGYIVEVYSDYVVFNGINLYYNEIMPDCSYIIPMGTSLLDPNRPTESKPTIPIVTKPTTEPTQADDGDTTEGYYMVGKLNGKSYWDATSLTNDRKLKVNYDTTGEYYLNWEFVDGDEIKVVYYDGSSIKTWYDSDADNYKLTSSGGKTGACTLYFNPKGRSDWSYTYFTVQKGTFTPVTPPETQEPTETPKPTETQKPTETPKPTETQKPTDAPIPTETQKPTDAPIPTETEPTEPKIMYGDVDMDSKISILDATFIQRHLAKLIVLTDEQITVGKVTGEEKLSILDATMIQRKLAKLIDKFPVEVANEKTTVSTSAGDVATLLATVKADLSKYYTYSSYDQYMAVKKCVMILDYTGDTSQTAYDELDSLYNELLAIIEGTGGMVGDTIDVYFTNTHSWSPVYAYVWSGSGNNGWPGEVMESVGKNEFQQEVFKITLETGKYDNIIFSNGTSSKQTVDLSLSNINNEGFYTTDEMTGGKYNCGTYIYGE